MQILIKNLINEILQDFYIFFKFWFYDFLRYIFNEYTKNFLIIEKKFSIRLNIKYFFAPLYGIKGIETYFYAIPLRIILIFISVFLHLINTFTLVLILLFWISAPFIISYLIYNGKIF